MSQEVELERPSKVRERRGPVNFGDGEVLLEKEEQCVCQICTCGEDAPQGFSAKCHLNSRLTGADEGAATLRDAVSDFDLVDVTEALDTFSPRFARWQGKGQARLDRVYYVSADLSDRITSYDAKVEPFSNHGFVATTLRAVGPRVCRA
ncbi:hypothetical protein HPB47_022922 [Ixodes persulcatus]|uniref:Uncharacterized protein n=1 Tax=Ixodes persulcatus TaxID=34615 RepID=A0AC60Q8F3_IXOPE|nr:hypothetical protein HPB47_022922 [Ixodes persulcatus]